MCAGGEAETWCKAEEHKTRQTTALASSHDQVLITVLQAVLLLGATTATACIALHCGNNLKPTSWPTLQLQGPCRHAPLLSVVNSCEGIAGF